MNLPRTRPQTRMERRRETQGNPQRYRSPSKMAKQLEVKESESVKKKEDLIVMSSVSLIILASVFIGIYFVVSKLPI